MSWRKFKTRSGGNTGQKPQKPPDCTFVAFVPCFSELDDSICPLYGCITYADVEKEFGVDPDWQKIKNDPQLLRGYAEIIFTTRQLRAGQVPDGWSEVSYCANCGSVFLETGGSNDLVACPWCKNRIQGLPIPRPVPPQKKEEARTVDQLSPAERSQWCMEHERSHPECRCPNKVNLNHCILWRAIREQWPLSRLHIEVSVWIINTGHLKGGR